MTWRVMQRWTVQPRRSLFLETEDPTEAVESAQQISRIPGKLATVDKHIAGVGWVEVWPEREAVS